MAKQPRNKINDLECKIRKLKNKLREIENLNGINSISFDTTTYSLIVETTNNDGSTNTISTSLISLKDEFAPNIVVDTFNDLPASANLFEFAEVRNEQGIKYLPGSLGGTYYAAGLYYWNGTDWIHDNDEILRGLNDLVTSINDIRVSTGWWNIQDTTFTSSNPLSILTNTRTKLQINADSVIDSFGSNNSVSADIWDDTNYKITPLQNGDSYIFRLSMTVNPTLNNRNFTVDLDIGGTQGIIFERSRRLTRGANVDIKISMTNSIFTLGTFIANGGEIYITCDGDVDIFNVSLFIQKVTQDD